MRITDLIANAERVIGPIRRAHARAFEQRINAAIADPDGYAVIYHDAYTQRLAARDVVPHAIDSAFADAYADAYQFTPAERDALAAALGAADGPGH